MPHCSPNRNNRFMIRKLMPEGLTLVFSGRKMNPNNSIRNFLLKEGFWKNQIEIFPNMNFSIKRMSSKLNSPFQDSLSQDTKISNQSRFNNYNSKNTGKNNL